MPKQTLSSGVSRFLRRGVSNLARRVRNLQAARMQRQFVKLNRNTSPDSISLRPLLDLRVDEESRHGFEHFCFRSPRMVREFDYFLTMAARRRCFVDVGALHGLFSLAFVHGHPANTALAIDPSPLAFSVLSKNLALNGCHNIRALNLAAGERAGELRMRFNWQHLEAVPSTAPDGDSSLVRVPMADLDSLCESMSTPPDLLKIDVEGYELFVLRGARRLLQSSKPDLAIEIHPQRLRELECEISQIVDLLEQHGYKFFDVWGKRLSRSRIRAQEDVFNLFCFQGEVASLPKMKHIS